MSSFTSEFLLRERHSNRRTDDAALGRVAKVVEIRGGGVGSVDLA
jgi:hypothetical protein